MKSVNSYLILILLTFACSAADAKGKHWPHYTGYNTDNICELYPITVSAALLSGASDGQHFSQLSQGTGHDEFTWLSWTGKNDTNTLARSLTPPGDSYTYRNPEDATDHVLDIQDWVEAVPGTKNSSKIRKRLQHLIGQEIVIPIWGQYSSHNQHYNRYLNRYWNPPGHNSFCGGNRGKHNHNSNRGQSGKGSRKKGSGRNNGQNPNSHSAFQVYDFATIIITDFKRHRGKNYLSFTYVGASDCNSTSTNTAPEASDSEHLTQENTPITITVTATDPEDDDLSFELVDLPTNGEITGTGPNYTYTPDPGFSGTDSFTFTASDGELTSDAATVSVEVQSVNNPPTAEDLNVDVKEDQSVDVTLQGSDPDSTTLTYTISVAPGNGAVTGDTPNITYTPNAGFVGTDTLTYVVSDGESSAIATVTFTVIQGDKAPTFTSTPVLNVLSGQTYGYDADAIDPNTSDVLSYSLLQAPEGMQIDPASGVIAWQPDPLLEQSSQLFNGQCYAQGESAFTPEGGLLVEQVRSAISAASDYATPETLSCNESNQCSGAYIQNQTLLGLQASKNKVSVDEQAADDLLNLILESQQENGTIVVNNLELENTQTSFALWALSYAPDRARTYQARANALDYMQTVKQQSGERTFWTADQISGWMRSDQAVTAITALAASRYISDSSRLEDITEAELATGLQYLMDVPAIARYLLDQDHTDPNNILLALNQIGLAELRTHIANPDLLTELDGVMSQQDTLLRSRQLADGGWALTDTSTTSDPVSSVWVGFALNYLSDDLEDVAISNNINYLLDTQNAEGNWTTTSDYFETNLGTTGLVMAYLPTALEFLGKSDLTVSNIAYKDENQSLNVQTTNRGVADANDPITVTFYSARSAEDSVILGSVELGGLSSDSSQTAVLSGISADQLGLFVYAVVDSTNAYQECIEDNNYTIAAVVVAEVTDLSGLNDQQIFTLSVDQLNQAPTIPSEALVVDVRADGQLVVTVEASDPNAGDALSYELVDAPAGMSIDPVTGEITWEPMSNQQGNYTITVTITDLSGATTTQTVTVMVGEANLPPVITSDPVITSTENQPYQYTVTAEDPDPEDVVEYSSLTSPQGATVDSATGLVQWQSSDEFIGNSTEANFQCLTSSDISAGSLDPVLKWRWRLSSNTASAVYGPIVVGQLTDDNEDGLINADDNPDLVFITRNAQLFIVDGLTGNTIFGSSTSQVRPASRGSAALADIDGDGIAEILVARDSDRYSIYAFEHDGTLKWQSQDAGPSPQVNRRDGITVADLDGDGSPEIIQGKRVYDANGNLLWIGTQDSGGRDVYGVVGVAADVNLDGKQEIVAGRTLYDFEGNVIWHQSLAATDGLNAVANFDDDDFAEIVLVATGQVYLLDDDGTILWSTPIPGGGFGGAPTVADFDGDGELEIGVAGGVRYAVFEADGTVKWQNAVQDTSSSLTGSSVFDFDLDGNAEVVYADEINLYVYDGTTGDILLRIANSSFTTMEYPVIADIDGDNSAEIIIGTSRGNGRGVRVYESASDSWAPTRALWNQYSYSINNINDDFSVPTQPVKSWLTHNTFRLNSFDDRVANGLIDLSVGRIALQSTEDGADITVQIVNRGLAPLETPVEVTYRSNGQLLGSLTLDALSVNESIPLTLAITDPDLLGDSITVSIETSALDNECLDTNDQATAAVFNLQASDPLGLFDTQLYAVSIDNINDAPVITSTNTMNDIVTQGQYSYQLSVEDPDNGDVLRYELLDAPEGMSVSNDGTITWIPERGADGTYSFTVTVTDLAGESDQELITLVVTERGENTAPTFTSSPLSAVMVNTNYTYQVEVADAENDVLTYELTTAPAGMTINSIGLISWLTENVILGTYPVEILVTDALGATTTQTFDLLVRTNTTPTITSLPDTTVFEDRDYSYQIIAEDGENDALTYSLRMAPAGMSLTVDGLLTWPASQSSPGTYSVEIGVTDGLGQIRTQSFDLVVLESGFGSGTSDGPVATNISPLDGTMVEQAIDVSALLVPEDGRNVESWVIEAYPVGEDPNDAALIAMGTGPDVNGVLDPTLIENGIWVVRFTATDDTGVTRYTESTVLIDTESKLGRYAISYIDLDISLGGVPFQMVRTYDSVDRFSSGDFGHGWNLDIANFRIQSSTTLGLGSWVGRACGGGFIFVDVCYENNGPRIVSVIWPNGKVDAFDVSFRGSNFFPGQAEVVIKPRTGVTSILSVSSADKGAFLSNNDGHFHSGAFGGGPVWNPDRWILKSTDGAEYLLDRNNGLVELTRPDGEKLTISENGVQSSRGPSITYVRDSEGRITDVSGPAGETLVYSYDAAGDLISALDPNGAETTFSYSEHYLEEIDDPGPGPWRTMTYDAAGRLASITDANGNTTAVSIDPDARTETRTAPDGLLTTITALDERGRVASESLIHDGITRTTSYEYNELDLVTRHTNPEGETWSFRYDQYGNLTASTDPEGAISSISWKSVGSGSWVPEMVTDKANNSWTYDYSDRAEITKITDPLGGVYEYTYANGRRTSITGPMGRTNSFTHNEEGQLATTIDPGGHKTEYFYDGSGRLIAMTDALGHTTRWQVDAVGNLTATIDPLGQKISYQYDGRDLITSMTDQEGGITRYNYNDNGRLLSETDPTGRTTSYTYEFDRLIEITNADGGVTIFDYDGAGRLKSVTDPLGRTTTYNLDDVDRLVGKTWPYGSDSTGSSELQLDKNGRVISTRTGDNGTILITRDPRGLVTAVTDPEGREQTFSYDALTRLTETTNGVNNTEQWQYNAAGERTAYTNGAGEQTRYQWNDEALLEAMIDPLGRTTSYEYDITHRRIATIDPAGNRASVVYDAADRVIASTSPAGYEWTYEYDRRGLRTSSTDALGNTMRASYDAAGRVIETVNARGGVTTRSYDDVGRIISLTDPVNATVKFGYDLAGQRTSVTDPNDAVRSYSYDLAGLIAEATDPMGRKTTMRYDANGRPLSVTDARGETINYDYDQTGLLVSENSSAGAVSHLYDDARRRIRMNDATGATSFAYDDANRIVQLTAPAGIVGYSYNTAGELTGMNQPQGSISYARDAIGYVEKITDWSGASADFETDADGRVLAIQRSNGIDSTHNFDAAGRLTGVAHARAGEQLEFFNYSLDADGNRTSVTSLAGTENYQLDAASRLTQVTTSAGVSTAYGYDPAGNRISKQEGGQNTAYTFDAAGQLLESSAGESWTYDETGNLLSDPTGGAFTWDAYGRLVSSSTQQGTEQYQYDGDDLRVGVNGTSHLWDRLHENPLLIADGSNGFVHGPGNYLHEADAGLWQHADALGSVRLSTDNVGQVIRTASYDVFGKPQERAIGFGFSGEWQDATGMLHLRARNYHSGSGRFLSSDSVQPNAPGAQGWNRYSYVANNPTTWTDPSGHVATVEKGVFVLKRASLVGAVGFTGSLWLCNEGKNPWDSNSDLDWSCVVTVTAAAAVAGGVIAAASVATAGSALAAFAASPKALCLFGAGVGAVSAGVDIEWETRQNNEPTWVSTGETIVTRASRGCINTIIGPVAGTALALIALKLEDNELIYPVVTPAETRDALNTTESLIVEYLDNTAGQPLLDTPRVERIESCEFPNQNNDRCYNADVIRGVVDYHLDILIDKIWSRGD